MVLSKELAINGGHPVIKKEFPAYNTIGKEEINAANKVLESGRLSGFLGSRGEGFHGGEQVRSLEKEVAEYFVLACTSEVYNETFNCTRGYGRKIIEAAELVKNTLGTGEIITKPHDKFYPSRDTLNSDKIKTMLNYAPSIDIETGIPEYINWFLKQKFYIDNLKINTTVHLDTVV